MSCEHVARNLACLERFEHIIGSTPVHSTSGPILRVFLRAAIITLKMPHYDSLIITVKIGNYDSVKTQIMTIILDWLPGSTPTAI